MNHSDHEPGSDCGGYLQPRAQYNGRRGVFTVWECTGCGLTNSPAVRRRLDAVRDRLNSGGGLRRTAETLTGGRTVKLSMSISRKSGAPGYGSDQAGAAIDVELDDEASAQNVLDQCQGWYHTLEKAVDTQLAGMQAKHPAPAARPGFASERQPTGQVPGPTPRPPAPEPRPEPAPCGPPPRSNGYGGGNGSQRQGGSGRDDPPRNGSQLLGWAYGHDKGDQLKRLAKEVDRGPIKTWDDEMVEWAYGELSRQPEPTGRWGGRG